jgi:peptide/nickel transport system substrate-binding protein
VTGINRGEGEKSARQHRRGGRRAILVATAAAAFIGPMTAITLNSSGAGAAASNNNTKGVLKYGFDINNSFTNFDPSVYGNDCGYTVTSNIYQSVTAPGQTAVSGGIAKSWTVSNNSSTVTFHLRPNLVFSNGEPVTSTDVMNSLNNTKKSPYAVR